MTTNSGPDDDTAKKPAKRRLKQPVKFKKAPQAPRRFKSAYMFFSTAKHPEIRARLKKEGIESEKTTKIAKMVSQEWKALSPEEKEKWEEMAREDKARYEMEKTMYTGPWKIPAKKRSQKDPNAPKRPMSAFLSFSNSKRAETRRAHPHCSNAEISRILAQLWKDAPEKEKKDHIDREFKLRQEYKVAIAAWKKNAENEAQAERQIREDVARKAAASRENAQAFGGAPHQGAYDDGPNQGYYGGQGDYYSQGPGGNNPYGAQQDDPASSYPPYGSAGANYAAYSSGYGSSYPSQYAAAGYGGGYDAPSSYYGSSSYGQGYSYYPPQQYAGYSGYDGGAGPQREGDQQAAMAEGGHAAVSAGYADYGA